MFSEFIFKKIRGARYKILADGTFFGEIPGLKGVWASADTLEDCRRELQEILEEWALLRIRGGHKVPGLALKIDRRHLVRHG